MLTNIILFLLGVLILYLGAEWLVKGSVRMARLLGITPLIIGLTVVGFGTSSPELVVSMSAALKKVDDIALGNIIGSNIANIGLVLGLSALISPLKINPDILKRELPIMLLVSLVIYWMSLDLRISFIEGAFLFAGIICFNALSYYSAKSGAGSAKITDIESLKVEGTRKKQAFLIALGLAGIVGGAQLMVRSAIFVARELGISELVIGLTVVALGTSLPELAASMVAAFRKESDISIGNVIGSNIFNILMVIGIVAMISPLKVSSETLKLEFPVMIIFGLALYPIMKTGLTISRIEGAILTAGYLGFVGYLFGQIFS
ncbi:MAG: calcium/sodium antiporter [Deltaproteobacteria bacterium]|nr:MAG: calcium/sodium antiporter [Deltaproteobacteria bacterium]